MSAPAPATYTQIRLESSKKKSIEFAFNDTHFIIRNLTEGTFVSRLARGRLTLSLFAP